MAKLQNPSVIVSLDGGIRMEKDPRHSQTYLMHGRGSRLKSLKLSGSWFCRLVIDHQLLRHLLWLSGGLSIDKINRKAFRIEDRGNMPTARGVLHLLNSVANALGVRELNDPVNGVNFSLARVDGC